jgi:predicted nucleic acid-binding protein
MGREGTGKSFPGDLVLDAGALIALERGDQRVAGLLERALALGSRVFVPATVLAQVWRGGPRSARLSRLVDASEVDSLDEARAKEVGVRLSLRSASADAHVVCCAIEVRAAIATSDQGDLRALAGPDDPLVLVPV